METPTTRGRDAVILQRQLDETFGKTMHMRRVSRSMQDEDLFFSLPTQPQRFLSSPRFGSPENTRSPIKEFQNGLPESDRLKTPWGRIASPPRSNGLAASHEIATPNSPPTSPVEARMISPIMGSSPMRRSPASPIQRHKYPQSHQPQLPESVHQQLQQPVAQIQSPQQLHKLPRQQLTQQLQQQLHQKLHQPNGPFLQQNSKQSKSKHTHPYVEPSDISKQHGSIKQPMGNYGSPVQAISARRRCKKCNGDISAHFVRALNAAYHIDCFTCVDCQSPCAAKFFPVDSNPLCEHCYFKRQNLLCYRCGNSLRGNYISAMDRKYHVDHFSCSLCTTVFGPDDSYFEYNGDVYCRCHYSALFAFGCEGCKSPILKQFVETYRGGKQQQWHPECYMIFKFWNAKVIDNAADEIDELRKEIIANSDATKPLDPRAAKVIAHEDLIDRRTMRTWTYLCGLEEACAAEISNLVQTAVNGQLKDAYDTCAKLVALIKVLFVALDPILTAIPGSNDSGEQVREPGKEAKTLCRKLVSYMSLISKTRASPTRERLCWLSKDLLTLASAMAHYLKVLIRQGLSGALKADKLESFLADISVFSEVKPSKTVSPFSTDRCLACEKAVEDKCYRQKGRNDRLWHARPQCFKCTKSGVPLEPGMAAVDTNGNLVAVTVGSGYTPAEFLCITKLEQYIILLHVALARLHLVLNNTKPVHAGNKVHSGKYIHYMDKNSAHSPVASSHKAGFASEKTGSETLSGDNLPTALERASVILNEKAGLTLDDIRKIVAAEQSSLSEPKVELEAKTSSGESFKYFGGLTDEEYAWVRYIGQAMLQPFTQKYLKKDFEAFNINTMGKQATLWGRVGKVFGAKESEGRVFGQPLDRLVLKHGVDSNLVAVDSAMPKGAQYTLRIPNFVDDCLTAMRQKDMSVEGIFRKNGNIRRQREFVEQVDRNPDENALLADESPIQLAALLKKFLRDLPEPLMCSKLSVLWSLAGKLERVEQVKLIQLLMCALPKCNRSLLEVLVNFLNWVSSFAHVDDETGSKMDISNLATVLGPTLALSTEDAAASSSVSIEGSFPSAVPNGSLNSHGTNGSSSPSNSAGGPHHAQGVSSTPFKSIGEPIKLIISDCTLVSRVPADVTKCLQRVKGSPRKLSYQEVQDILKSE